MPLTCLLIDDDQDDRDIFAIALEEADTSCTYITAENGTEGIKLLSNLNFIPDFIFLDLNMPKMNGMECLREIKKIGHISHVPVIIYSTSSYDKDVEAAKQLGASYFLTKPSSIPALTNSLKEILNKRKLEFFLIS